MAKHVPAENNPYGQYLRSELQLISTVNDSYLSHDHLEVHNEALYFRDFMARANSYGLDYLGESEFSTMVGAGVSRDAYQQLNTEIKDIVRLEQYLDFMRNRTFRMTLLVKQGSAVLRNVTGDRMRSLWIAAALVPTGLCDPATTAGVTFQSATGQGLQTGNPITKAALLALKDCFPGALAFAELLKVARDRLPAAHRSSVTEDQDSAILSNDLLVAYTAAGTIQLFAASPGATATPGDQPVAGAYARWQANTIPVLTSALHESVRVDDPARLLLPFLDGAHDRAALQRELHRLVTEGKVNIQRDGQVLRPEAGDEVIAQALDSILLSLASQGLICA